MKKRILSLILALSMVLSVLPLGAFAEGSTQDLVMQGGFPDCSGGTSGNGWSYDNNTQTLTLTSGSYDFNYTNPKTPAGMPTNRAVQCAVMTQSGVTITGGTFNGGVFNSGTITKRAITDSTFNGVVTNNAGGTISGGTFNATVTNNAGGKISGGAFQSTGSVTNYSYIENGTFNGTVTNYTGVTLPGGTISGGTFYGSVTNLNTIEKGTFEGNVTNSGTISGGTFQNGCSVENYIYIENGTFYGSVKNYSYIENGTFEGTVTNDVTGYITGGTFQSTCSVTNTGIIKDGIFTIKVENGGIGEIFGGIFAAGLSKKSGNVAGGVFNGKTGLDGVTGLHSITWDAASSKAKIVAVNDVSAVWDPYAYKDTTVTITADTEIYSLNGKSIDDGNCNSSYGSDRTTVTFTMPGENVVLNGAITCTDLVMKKGYPEDSNGGTTPCEGTGWTYSKKDASNPKGKLTLTDGTYDFSYTYPQNSNGAGAEPVACAVETQLRVKITGGTFEGEVINNDLGVISGGTFHEKVSNYNGMITGGTFKSSVTSKGYGRIFGGVFNGNATLTNVTGLHSITVASGAKIKEVNGMSADWDPYVVVTENATTNEVIITADTEIFSLNGKSIGDGNCKSSYPKPNDKKTVKFTMPGEPVVLNGAITCTDLVMEKGWPQASNEGKISCSGTGWSYDHITKTLTLTSGEYDFSSTEPVQCAIQSSATITGGTFEKKVTNNAGGIISGGTFQDTCSVTNEGTIKNGTFKSACSVTNNSTIENGTFKNMCSVENNGTINNGTFTYKVENNGIITGGVFNRNANLTGVTGGYNITVASNAKIEKVNGVSADWAPYVVTSNATTKEVTITADTEIFSLNGQPIVASNCNSSYGNDKTTVTFTMPDDDVVLNGAITSTDLVMVNGYPKDSDGGKTPCKGDGWQYIPNDPTYGNMLLLTGSSQTGGLFDFSTIGDGLAVKCNVFVGKPTAITGGEFNGKVFNNSGILGGTFHGEVDNMGPGRIENGTFHGAVENNGIIENGTFNDEVKNNGTINGGVFNGAVTGSGTVSGNITGSGTLNGEPITKPEPTPEPEPTTYTVTVIGGTIDGKTSVSAKENDTLTVVLDQSDIPDGMTFDMWSISSSKLSGDINVDYRAEAMTFQMPAEDVTIRAQYRSAEIIEDAAPSPLATAATVAVGGAAAGIVVWQGVNLGVDLYLANALPQGVPVPTDRRALALLLWETAGKPEVALPTLYGDIPAEEIELQKATRWAVQNGLMDAADKKDASFFDPDHYVTKMDVFGAWLRLKKLLGTT